jgi:ferrous iron transport protein B
MWGRLIRYDEGIESAINKLCNGLKGSYVINKRAIALLLLQGDEEVERWVKERGEWDFASKIVAETRGKYNQPLSYIIGWERQREAQRLSTQALIIKREIRRGWGEGLSRLMMDPKTGWLFILFSLVGLFYFVGVLGAGVLVDCIEGWFETRINPWVNNVIAFIPWSPLQGLFAGEYGLITLGLRYALAIILPIVTTFFIAFSILEDSGYLPRLAMFLNRLFKFIGLSGRAVIPTVLGFGCVTMATLVTRTLESKRERLISTLLFALAIP